MWGRIYDNAEYATGGWAAPALLIAAMLTAGAALLLVRATRHQPRPGRSLWTAWSPDQRGRAIAWGVLSAWVALLYVSTISYIASGGGVHGRYLLPGLPAAAVLAAAALDALPGRRWAVAPIVTVAVMTTTGLVWAARFADFLRPDQSWWGAAMAATAADANGVPALVVAGTIALAVAGAVTTAVALLRLSRIPHGAFEAPTVG